VDRLFVLDFKTIVTECRHPDGIVVDVEDGYIYWF